MVKKPRRHSEVYSFQVALGALKVSKTIGRLFGELKLHNILIRPGKRQLLEDGSCVGRQEWRKQDSLHDNYPTIGSTQNANH